MQVPELRAADAPDAITLDQRVLREHLASVYFIYNHTFLARFGFIGVFGAFLYWQLRTPAVIAFVAGHLLLYAVLSLQPRWTPDRPAADSPRWVRRLTVIVGLLGAADAFAPWLFVPAGNLPVTAVLTVVMLGNCARAVQSLRPIKPAMYAHTIPMVGGLIAALLAQGDGWHLFLAAFVAINLWLTLRVGAQEHRRLTDALLLRFENEALARQLREQVAATERASAEKSRFLAAASHDLRQPLHAIALFGAALETSLRGSSEGRNATRLMHAVNTLGTSLDTMLDVSRLDAGAVAADPRPLRLDAVLLSLNHVFAPQAEHKQLQLRLRASGLWVHSDPQLLGRMLSNLIDNAVKYTRQGGVMVTARARGEVAWIDVIDTGCGIAPDQIERIFEEFYQVGNPARDRSKGLGIGLAIVRRLARLLQHPVEVRSRLGRGSRLRVIVPLAKEPPEQLSRGSLPGIPGTTRAGLPRRVLLLDDEVAIREAMAALLATWSVAAAGVADEAAATTALAQAEEAGRPFDMLICDYRLPGSDTGLDIGLRLHRRFAIARPLLLVTGETAPESMRRVREAGVAVLFKPVDAAALRRILVTLG